jgi:hypothetical protein
MKKIILALTLALVLGSCTKDFVSSNQNPYQITNESLLQDNNLLGSPFSSLMANLFGDQIEENLIQDSFTRQMATPTPFAGGINNTTYYIRWNTYWDRIYGSIMSPSQKVIKLADAGGYKEFSAWAKMLRILGMSRLTTFHGPVIYSNYGSQASTILYDKESDLYNLFFKQLDTIQSVFKANPTYAGFKNFDASYGGDVTKWLKLTNSIRLRLAIRLSKVAPDIAKTQGEKALADASGLISTNGDNFNISLYGNILPLARICWQWDDTRMGDGMESILVGLKDGRLPVYFQPASDNTLYADHPAYPYKGIRNGAFLNSKSDHMPCSKINTSFNTTATRRYMTAAEVSFLKAEASLRGWAGAGDAKTNYENGVRLSYADWGATGVDAYLADATSKPINFNDPIDARNSFTSRSTVTVAWNEADSKELKLEKIITQKWIDGFTNALEAWVDFRRTGYPKLPYNAKNDSNADWGVIGATDFIKRMPFVNGERSNNAAGVADAVSKMGTGAKDDIATRLWWDTGVVANF